MTAHCLIDARASLGESPVWSAAEDALYWVDILGRKIHRTNPETGETESWDVPGHPGMIALRRRGGLVVALDGGLFAFDPDRGRAELLVPFDEDRPDNRPNDGKCDAAGRLWVGTMNKIDGGRPTGRLFCISPDLSVSEMEDGLCIPNGLAWSPDDARMIHTDTRSGVVRAWDFDAASGTRGPGKTFFRFDRATMGGVDGAAMDAEGGYWAAMYGGGKLIRVMPDGSVEREIPLPVGQPTMPAFGGPDMKSLFVTTARQKLSDDDLVAQPLAGGLFRVSVDIPGHPVHSFGG